MNRFLLVLLGSAAWSSELSDLKKLLDTHELRLAAQTAQNTAAQAVHTAAATAALSAARSAVAAAEQQLQHSLQRVAARDAELVQIASTLAAAPPCPGGGGASGSSSSSSSSSSSGNSAGGGAPSRAMLDGAAAAAQRRRLEIVSQYGGDAQVFARGMWGDGAPIVARLARAIALGGQNFTFAVGGSSVTAAHDCYAHQAYPLEMERALWPVFAQAGVRLVVRNHGMGGTAALPFGFCLPELLGADADVVVHEFDMLEAGWGGFPAEVFVRNALALPRAPAVLLVHADQPRKQKLVAACTGQCEQIDRDTVYEPLAQRTEDIAGTGAVCPPLPTAGEADLVAHYGKLGLHSNSQLYAVCDLDHRVPYRWVDLTIRGKVGKHADWHPGPEGHRLRGLQLAHWYLGLLAAAAEQVAARLREHGGGANAAGMLRAAFGADIVPHVLPEPYQCDAAICGTPPTRCATSIAPKVGGELGELMINGSSAAAGEAAAAGGGGWTLRLSPEDVAAVRFAEEMRLGYADRKWAFTGGAADGWARFSVPGAKGGGPLLLCEPNHGWRREPTTGALAADAAFELDGAAVEAVGTAAATKAYGPVWKELEIENKLCVMLSLGLEPGDHTVGVKATTAGKVVTLSHLVWW